MWCSHFTLLDVAAIFKKLDGALQQVDQYAPGQSLGSPTRAHGDPQGQLSLTDMLRSITALCEDILKKAGVPATRETPFFVWDTDKAGVPDTDVQGVPPTTRLQKARQSLSTNSYWREIVLILLVLLVLGAGSLMGNARGPAGPKHATYPSVTRNRDAIAYGQVMSFRDALTDQVIKLRSKDYLDSLSNVVEEYSISPNKKQEAALVKSLGATIVTTTDVASTYAATVENLADCIRHQQYGTQAAYAFLELCCLLFRLVTYCETKLKEEGGLRMGLRVAMAAAKANFSEISRTMTTVGNHFSPARYPNMSNFQRVNSERLFKEMIVLPADLEQMTQTIEKIYASLDTLVAKAKQEDASTGNDL